MQEPVIVKAAAIAKGYRVVPDWLMCRTEITPGAKLVYAVLLAYGRKDDYAYPSQERLSADIGISGWRQVSRYISELKNNHLILINRKNRQKQNHYFFLVHPWMNLSESELKLMSRHVISDMSEVYPDMTNTTYQNVQFRRSDMTNPTGLTCHLRHIRHDNYDISEGSTPYILNIKLNNKLNTRGDVDNSSDSKKQNGENKMASIKLPITIEDEVKTAKELIERSLRKEKKGFGFDWAAKFLAKHDKETLVNLIKSDVSNVFGRELPNMDKNKIV